MKKIFVQSSKKKIQIAITKKKKLCNFNIEHSSYKKTNNVYLGVLKDIIHSLEAVFVDYGEKKLGLLPFKNISKNFLKNKKINFFLLHKNYFLNKKITILIQILKFEKRQKGGLLTNFITLSGIYLILLFEKPHIRKISNKIIGIERLKLKFLINFLKIPQNIGIIIRTNALGRSFKELQKDFIFQIKKWELINYHKNDIFLLEFYQKDNIYINLFRKITKYKIYKIIIDNKKIFKKIKKLFIQFYRKDLINCLKLFKKNISLFSYYNLINQISSIFYRKIILPSGGILIIDFTEALTVIDVNSSIIENSFTIENTALKINYKAASEIIRQIRLKDIGGIIIIDFISMKKKKNKIKIENFFKKLAAKEFSKIIVGKISKFGLLEISRKKKYSLS